MPAVYLVEKLDPNLELIEESDVTMHLPLAVQTALGWLQDCPRRVRAQVDVDGTGELEGIGFFDEHNELVVRIAVYWLERESADEAEPYVREMLKGELATLAARLQLHL
jgi:hypothetical protein